MKQFMKELKIKLMSRKFQALMIGVIAFFFTNKFSETSLLTLLGIYIGSNTIQKFIDYKNVKGAMHE